MGSRDFNPMDVFLQLEADLLQGAGRTMRSLHFQPCMDMYETDSALIVKLELAGVHADRLNITLSADNRTLTVSGERAESSEERRDRVRCYQLEIFYGAFERHITLPAEVRIDRDNIRARYRDGFLVIVLPIRKEPASTRRSIQINAE